MNNVLGRSTAAIAALCCAAFTLAMMPAAQAQDKGVEYYMSSPGSIRGGPFTSLAQCQATASGINGSCYQTPSAAATPAKTNANAYAYAPAHRGHRHLQK